MAEKKTLHDEIAIAALQGMLAAGYLSENHHGECYNTYEDLIGHCNAVADEYIKTKKRRLKRYEDNTKENKRFDTSGIQS